MIAALHQPNFMPYLGFFDKMQKSDILVIRDEVLFTRKDFHQRNRIRINSNDNLNNPQFKWLKVPVKDMQDYIMHIAIELDAIREGKLWSKQILHEIKVNYEKSQHFDVIYPKLEKIFISPEEKLIDLNMKIITTMKELFEMDTETIFASKLGLKPEHYEKSDASEDIVKICKEIGADTYLSGDGGKKYLNIEPFKKENITLTFQEYAHPVYKQQYPGFIPYMSAIDALFCTNCIPK